MQLGLDLSSYKCQNQSKLSSSKVDAPTLHAGMMRMALHTTVTGILKVRTVQPMAVHTQESQARLPIKPAASVKLLGWYQLLNQQKATELGLGYQLLNQQKPMQLGLDLSSYKCQNQSKLSSSKRNAREPPVVTFAATLQTGMMRMVL